MNDCPRWDPCEDGLAEASTKAQVVPFGSKIILNDGKDPEIKATILTAAANHQELEAIDLFKDFQS